MALTANGLRVGRAGASDLADLREYIQIEQEAEAKRRRAEVRERTEKLIADIASMMFDEEYKAWLDTTPNDNEGFLKACEVKYTELTTAPHPVNFTQDTERALSSDSDMVAETQRDLNWVGTGSELKFGNVIFDLDAMGENARQRSAELKKRIDQRQADAQARRKADEIRALGGEA